MTIIYKGIRRKVTDVLEDYGQAHYMQNVRLKRVGELGRRAGLGKSTMGVQAGPVQFMIGAWSDTSFIVNGTGGDVFGQENPLAYWTAATMRKPGGLVGQPVAPVITAVVAVPASPQAYPAGAVTFTPTITYDGLSGALIYSWQQLGGPSSPTPTAAANGNSPTWATTFDAFCIPGTYNFSVGVTTTVGALTGSLPFSFVVT